MISFGAPDSLAAFFDVFCPRAYGDGGQRLALVKLGGLGQKVFLFKL